MSVTGVTATVQARPEPGQAVIGAHVVGVTAAVVATPGVGAPLRTSPGDQHNQPIDISGATGSVALDFNASIQPGEPDVASGGEPTTMWLRYTAPDIPGALNVVVDADHYVEVFAGEPGAAVSDLEPVDVQSGAATDYSSDDPPDFPPVYTVTADTLQLSLAAGDVALIRAYPSAGAPSPWTFAWDYIERVPQLVLAADDLDITPGQLSVVVTNVDPEAEVTFSLTDMPDFHAETADLSGVLSLTLPIDVELAAGTHTLTATTVTGQDGTTTFEVANDPAPRPAPLPAIPDPQPAPVEVAKWYVEDPTTTARTFWVYNPTETTSPYAAQQFALRTTTSPGGQALTWEGALRAQEWTLSGYLDTEAAYTALAGFVASERRYWVVDHRRQYRLVSFEAFDPAYKRSVVNGDLNNWSFTYTLTLLVYRHLLAVGA